MVSYNTSDVVQCTRQYEMFAHSLNLVRTREEKEMIIKQLTKLEEKILELTNEIYKEEYYSLANKECGLIDEELKRLDSLIELINQRLTYVEKACNNHYQLTGQTIDVVDSLGTNTLDELEERVDIITKYSKNISLKATLEEEVNSLNNKISLANEKININNSLNDELEKKFKDLLSNSFEANGYYELIENKKDIEDAYYEAEKSLTLAELNLETAKTSPLNLLDECQEMLNDIKVDYNKYKEQMSIIKLMEIYNEEVNEYEDLLNKRKEVNELIKHIKNPDFINMVSDLLSNQYNTIMMEQQDVNTFDDLTLERERKLETLQEIEEENNSEKFQNVLQALIENEKARQKKLEEEKIRIEEEEKKRRIEIEKKRQEEILKRQRIIEDTRKKEMEKRTRELLEQQQKSFLNNKSKDKSNNVSFENIKNISEEEDVISEELKLEPFHAENNAENSDITLDNDLNLKLDFSEFDNDKFDDNKVKYKDKNDIEKELFEEFNSEGSKTDAFDTENNEKDEFKLDYDNLPMVDLDEYMKNFNEEKAMKEDTSSLFKDEEFFPSIPLE